MPYFKDQEQLYEVLDAFFGRVCCHPQIGGQLNKNGIVASFIYTNPFGCVTVDFTGDRGPGRLFGKYHLGKSTIRPQVSLVQSADVGHRFWHGKVNLMAALACGEVVAEGSIPRALTLTSALRPAFDLYPRVLDWLGYGDLVLE